MKICLTPDSDIADKHPASPSEDYKSYSQLIARIAKVLNLAVAQLPPQDEDHVYEDVNQEHAPPLCLAFIKSFLHRAKESWDKPSLSEPISQQVDNLYKTHGDDTTFLRT